MTALCLEINRIFDLEINRIFDLQFLSINIIIVMVINSTNDRMIIPDGRFAIKGN